MTLNKHYGLLLGLLVVSSGSVMAMNKMKNPNQSIDDNNNNNVQQDECYLCLDDLGEDAVRLSENCQHKLHKECYDELIADDRVNSLCGLCRKPIVKPKVVEKPKVNKPRKVVVKNSGKTDILCETKLVFLYNRALQSGFDRIKNSRQLASLHEQGAISQADYTTILKLVANKNASALTTFLKGLRRKR